MNNILGLNSTRTGESRGVSPVIATVLVVEIVVIISASIAAVTLGYTDQLGDPAPTAAFEFDYEGGWEITHTQGDQIDPSKLQVQVEDPDKNASGIYPWSGSEPVTAGTAVAADVSNTTSNEELSVVWDGGDRSYRVASSSSTGSGSGSSGGGGGNGTVAGINAAFADDPSTSSNEITVSVVDEDGNPIADEELTVSVVDPNKGLLTVYDSSGDSYGDYDNKETLTVTTNSVGEFKTATGEGSDAPVGSVEVGPRGGSSDLDSGDTISARIESTSTSVEETISFEYN